MSGIIWTKFFWSDWETDPALRHCSFAAQGLWMRMLCIAAAHDPIGYVAVAGRGLDETSIARMTGGLESEVSTLLGELDRNGVFSRDRHGRIFSRRMVSDAKKAATARKNGKFGGNPKLCNDGRKTASVKGGDKGGLNTQEPEAISHKLDEDACASSPAQGAKAAKQDRRKPETPIPDGFPDDQAIAAGQALLRIGGYNVDARVQAERFRNHALAHDRRLRDWTAGWRTWLSKATDGAPVLPFRERREIAPEPARAWAGPPDLRAAVVKAMDEAWTVTWLDRCAWRDLPTPTIVPATRVGVDRIGREVGHVLQHFGVVIEAPERATA